MKSRDLGWPLYLRLYQHNRVFHWSANVVETLLLIFLTAKFLMSSVKILVTVNSHQLSSSFVVVLRGSLMFAPFISRCCFIHLSFFALS